MRDILRVHGFVCALALAGLAHADGIDRRGLCVSPSGTGPWFGGPPARGREPVLVVDRAHYPPVTRFIFLETKKAQIDDSYHDIVRRFVDGLSHLEGFQASMTLEDVDLKRMSIYYQFSSAADYARAREFRNGRPLFLGAESQALQDASTRFEDFGATPHEQSAPGGQRGSAPSGYRATFRLCDGVGINEAVVNSGRTQVELTRLMHDPRNAFDTAATPGFKDSTFHTGVDGSRNMTLMHYATLQEMSSAAVGPITQATINNGITGGYSGWGPQGPGTIDLHAYLVTDIRYASK